MDSRVLATSRIRIGEGRSAGWRRVSPAPNGRSSGSPPHPAKARARRKSREAAPMELRGGRSKMKRIDFFTRDGVFSWVRPRLMVEGTPE